MFSRGPFLIVVALVFFSTSAYISCRMYQCLHAVMKDLRRLPFGLFCAGITALALLALTRSRLDLAPAIKYALALFSGYWMAAYIYLLLTLLAGDILIFLSGMLKILPFPVTARIRCIAGFAAVAVTAVLIIAGTVHADRFVHRTYAVSTEKITGGRQWNIVLISDLHIGAVRSEDRLASLVEEINAEEPDLVCIAGDIFDNDFEAIRDKDKCAETLRGIRAKYGVFACLGNHDAGDTLSEMTAFLPACGITLLDERYTVIDGSLILAGRLDGSPIGGAGTKRRGAFADFMTGADESLPIVVLDHTPSHFDEYPDRVDLIFCGHTHRGQIFPGCLFTQRLFPVDYGLYRETETSPTVIVTSGAGTWGMPVRVGTDSEIVSVKLSGE